MRKAGWVALFVFAAAGGIVGWTIPSAPVVPERPRERRVSPEPTLAPLASPEDAPSLEQALVRLSSAEESSTRAITGRVMIHDWGGGAPRPAASLRLIAEPEASYEELSLEEKVSRYQLLRRAERSTETDAEGKFVFEDLLECFSYRIRSAQSAPAQVHRARAFRPGEEAELVAFEQDQVTLELTVQVVKDGEAVSTARLDVRRAGSHRDERSIRYHRVRPWRASDPTLHLGKDTWQVRALCGAELASKLVEVELTESTSITLELEECTTLVASITMEEGHSGLNRLYARRRPTGSEPASSVIPPVPAVDGGFWLQGIEPGLYELRVGSRSERVAAWEVEVVPGLNRVALEIPPPGLEDLIQVSVTDADGSPVEGLGQFSLNVRDGGRSSGSSLSPALSRGHHYFLRPGGDFGLALGRPEAIVELSVNHPNFIRHSIVLDASQSRYEFVFPPQAELRVLLPGLYERDLVGCAAVSVFAGDDDRFAFSRSESFRPDWLGESVYEKLPAGPARLVVSYLNPDLARPHRLDWVIQEIELSRGANIVEVDLPELFALEIEFPADLIGEYFFVKRRDLRGHSQSVCSRRVVSDQIERFTVPAGEYWVRVGSVPKVVNVQSDIRCQFEATEFTALEVVRTTEYHEELGLQAGDVVVAIDAQPFSEPRPSRWLWNRLEAHGSVTLTCERAEQRFDVVLEKEHLEPRNFGFRAKFR